MLTESDMNLMKISPDLMWPKNNSLRIYIVNILTREVTEIICWRYVLQSRPEKVLDCIDSWSLQPYLLLVNYFVSSIVQIFQSLYGNLNKTSGYHKLHTF